MKKYYAIYHGGFHLNIKGFHQKISRFHGKSACFCDPYELELYDFVEKRNVQLEEERVTALPIREFRRRKYPKGTLIYNALHHNYASNPYLIFFPADSWEEAVQMIKNGVDRDPGFFTLRDYVEEKNMSVWEMEYLSPLFGTPWMDSSILPPQEVKYENGGILFETEEEAKAHQDGRWTNKPENARGDWNTILVKKRWII